MAVSIVTETLKLSTQGHCDIIDITQDVGEIISKHKMQQGHVLIFCPGSTGGITTVEYEPGLLKDLPAFYQQIIPQAAHYHHEDTWHDGNGHSHVRASLLKPDLNVPFANGEMILGTWQQIILIDFDNGARQRKLVVQLTGE